MASEKVPTIVLCGGQGTRIREASESVPKPMLEIGGLPILWHILKTYGAHGQTDFVLALGHLGHVVKDFFLNYRTRVGDFSVGLGDGKVTLHGAGAEAWQVTCAETGEGAMTGCRVRRAGSYIKGQTFMVTYGDGVGDVDITALLKFHRAHGKLGTVTGVRPPGRFGELKLEAGGRVSEFNEKPQVSEGYINGGFMVFERAFLDAYLSGREDEILEREPLMKLARDGQLMMFAHEGFWQPMDTPREYAQLNALWASGKAPWAVWKR